MNTDKNLGGTTAPAKRILILGASGMLGHMHVRVMSQHHHVIGTTSSKYEKQSPLARILSKDNWIDQVDVRNLSSVEQAIQSAKPDVVINCVGMIKQKMGAENNVDTIHINSLFPHQLAGICIKSNSRLIHFSTDCVFQGTPGIKRLSDTPNATDLYGLSKFLGEIAYDSCLTLRTSIVGRQLFGSESLFEWAISQRGTTISGYRNATYTGLTTIRLCHIVKDLVEVFPNLSGLFQVASSPISKFELISKINNLLQLNLSIEPDTNFYCDRTLDGTEFKKLTNIEIPSWDEMLNEFTIDQNFYN
jgi:dTDP-4-dehydrorhamnose reductase